MISFYSYFYEMNVFQFPLTRITIAFVMGIVVANYFVLSPIVVFWCLIIAFCIFGIAYFVSIRKSEFSLFFGLTTFFMALGIGITTQTIHTNSFQKHNYIHHTALFEKSHLISVTIREKLSSTVYNDRYIVLVNQIDNAIHTGKMLLSIPKDTARPSLEIGSNLLFNGSLSKNNTIRNPNQFDYGKYLARKQIYAQIYADPSQFIISPSINKDIWYYASRLRTKIIQNLQSHHFNKSELDVVVALILGQKQDIAPEIMKDYQFAGAVHILSVSGLHVGFILLFINFLLKPIPNTKRGSLIKLIISIGSLFSFGVIAGLAPSVLRSVTMFSFVAIGMYLKRSTNIYHTLIVSILLILLFEPSFLFDVGFQLSYTALFFILWLQPLLKKLWEPENKVTNYFWDILTVSVAAQIGALPLSIYYFHQFPGLFFITNLIIIPFLIVIMGFGVFVMVLAAFDSAPYFLVKMLQGCVFILNKIINTIASFEQFIIQDIPFNFNLLVSVYFLIVVFILWFKKPSFHRFSLAIVSVIIFQTAFLFTNAIIQNQTEMIFFNAKKTTLVTERIGRKIIVYANDSVLKTVSNNKFLATYIMENFGQLDKKIELKNVLFFKGKRILILDSLGIYPKNCHPDVVVLTQSPKINLERFLQISKPKLVLADASNYSNIQQLWKSSCLKAKIPFHATAEKGFYRME